MTIELPYQVLQEHNTQVAIVRAVAIDVERYHKAVVKWEAAQARLRAEDERIAWNKKHRVRDPRGSKAGVKRGPYRKGRLLWKERTP